MCFLGNSFYHKFDKSDNLSRGLGCVNKSILVQIDMFRFVSDIICVFLITAVCYRYIDIYVLLPKILPLIYNLNNNKIIFMNSMHITYVLPSLLNNNNNNTNVRIGTLFNKI